MDAGNVIHALRFIRAAVYTLRAACRFQRLVHMHLPPFAVLDERIRGIPELCFGIPAAIQGRARVWGYPHQVLCKSLGRCLPYLFFPMPVLVYLFPSLTLGFPVFTGCKRSGFVSAFTDILLLCLWHPVSVLIQRPDGKEQVCMGVAEYQAAVLCDPVSIVIHKIPVVIPQGWIMDADIHHHAVFPEFFCEAAYQGGIFLHGKLQGQGDFYFTGKPCISAFFCLLHGIPQYGPVLVF